MCLRGCRRIIKGIKARSPVLTKDRVIQDNLLKQLNELIWKVSSHEGLHRDRYLLWILRL